MSRSQEPNGRQGYGSAVISPHQPTPPAAAAVVVNGVRTKCGAVHNNNSAAEQVRVVDKGC